MPGSPNRFIYSFFILFMSVLLLLFILFMVMVHYDRGGRTAGNPSTAYGEAREVSDLEGETFRDFTKLYRANLFMIDLCLIVLAEAALILLFVRFTIPAVLVATVALLIVTANSAQPLRDKLIPRLLSSFVTNKYATLTYTDLILLIMLSGVIMAFLMSVLLKQAAATPEAKPPQEMAPPSVSREVE
jgi:hypothetical protein